MIYENRQGTLRGSFNGFFITEYEDDTGTIEHIDQPRFKCRYAYDEEMVNISGFTYEFSDDDGETDVTFFDFEDQSILHWDTDKTREIMRKAYSALEKFVDDMEEGRVMLSLNPSQDDEILDTHKS